MIQMLWGFYLPYLKREIPIFAAVKPFYDNAVGYFICLKTWITNIAKKMDPDQIS